MTDDVAWADQLLDALDFESVPAGYEALASVLLATRLPATDAELAGQALAVDRFRSSRHRPTSRRAVRSTRAVVAGVVLGAMTATGVAAAAGRLPADLQDVASEVAAKLGIHVPPANRPRPAPVDDSDSAPPDTFSIPATNDPIDMAGPLVPGPLAAGPDAAGPAEAFSRRVGAAAAVRVPDLDAVAPDHAGTPPQAPASDQLVATLPSTAERTEPAGIDAAESPPAAANGSPSGSAASEATVVTMAAGPPVSVGPPASLPASENASSSAGVGPPLSVPADANASSHVPGPPESVPANANASPHAPGPPVSTPGGVPRSDHHGNP